jgi:hypothetical protein
VLVWLASYPRSGNTLLRQVLKTCFNIDSCAGLEPGHAAKFATPNGALKQIYGEYYYEGDAEEFYLRARRGPEPVFVKTHQFPRDDAKTIYIVRDGRLALRSFLEYQDRYHPRASSFVSLLMGDHPYGDWSGHFRAWCEARRGETLVVRFEELIDAGAVTLARLARFLGRSGPVRPWSNPQAQLREMAPMDYGPGAPVWSPDPFWSETRLRQFLTLHGPLLTQLGYAAPSEVDGGAHPAGSDEETTLSFARDVVARRNALQVTCDERQTIIDRLAGTCAERLALIERLAGTCAERLALIERLDSALRPTCKGSRASRVPATSGRPSSRGSVGS